MIIKLTSLLILTLSCQQTDSNLDKFYNFLGDEQSKVLQEAVDYFNQFLDDNFKNEKNKKDKINKFLKYYADHEMRSNDNWKYKKEECKLLIDKFEKTGLRKEIWMYGYETYQIDSSIIKYYENYQDSVWSIDTSLIGEQQIDIEGLMPEIDDSMVKARMINDSLRYIKSKTTTPYSRVIIGINKFKTNDSLIYHYTNGILTSGDISPSLLIHGLLKADNQSYDDPFFDILIIKELFYGLMENNCK